MVDYQTIAELVSQIPVDTWNLLREIKQRRPAMMLSELIDYNKRVSQTPQRSELGSPTKSLLIQGREHTTSGVPAACAAASPGGLRREIGAVADLGSPAITAADGNTRAVRDEM